MKKITTYFLLITLTLVISSPLALAVITVNPNPGTPADWEAKNPNNPQPGENIGDYYERIGQAIDPGDVSIEDPATGPSSFGTPTIQGPSPNGLGWLLNVATAMARKVIDWVSMIAGMVVVLMIIWGGILYIQGKTDEGKKTILSAVIGAVIILLSITIVNVFKMITGG
jgi:hypothetical protein